MSIKIPKLVIDIYGKQTVIYKYKKQAVQVKTQFLGIIQFKVFINLKNYC